MIGFSDFHSPGGATVTKIMLTDVFGIKRNKVCEKMSRIIQSTWGVYRCQQSKWSNFLGHPVDQDVVWTSDDKVFVRVVLSLLEFRGDYSATSNNMKLVHLPLMGGLLHLVQRGEDCAGPQPSQAPRRCTKCNSSRINGQCTNHRIVV